MAIYLDTSKMSLSHEPPGAPIPLPVAFALMPVVGLAFLMFLPAIGFWLTGKWLLVESARGMARLAALLHRTA